MGKGNVWGVTSVSWRVPAKVNLSLAIGPGRDDGYHDLATVFHAISLSDVITAEPSSAQSPAITMTAAHDGVDVGAVPTDASNLAVRAASALAARLGRAPAVALHIDKAIPVAGGLAGGSADAAGALLACNDLWRAGLTTAELCDVAADLGSDVPFAVTGGTAVGTGRGEILHPLEVAGDLSWVVVSAARGLSTPAVYRRLDEMRIAGSAPAPRGPLEPPPDLVTALAAGDLEAVATALENDMEAAALELAPELSGVLAAGRFAGASAGLVSGSGPTCVFLTPSAAAADEVAAALEHDGYAGRVMTATGPRTPQRVA